MTRTHLHRTIGMVIPILAAVAFTAACAAQEEAPSPRHVSPRLIVKVPRGYMAGLNSVTYSPDGQLVASGQWEGQIRAYDPVTGKELRRIDVGSSHSAWVAFSPDGRQLVCAMGYSIRKFPLLDFESGKILKTFEGAGHGSRLAVFSPDGGQILVSHAGLWNFNRSQVVLWDAATGERIKQLCQGTDETPVSIEAASRLQRDHMPACYMEDNWCDDGCMALEPLVKSPATEPDSSG